MVHAVNNARPLNFFEAHDALLSKAQQIVALLPVVGCSTHITVYGAHADRPMTLGIGVWLHYGNRNDHPTHPLILVEMTGNHFTTEAELLADLAKKCEVANPFAAVERDFIQGYRAPGLTSEQIASLAADGFEIVEPSYSRQLASARV